MDLLAVIRLSDFRENSASPEQQAKTNEDYAALHGHRIIHTITDEDVSGDYGPFHAKRGELADWLLNRSDQYDGIICRAINRVARNAEQMLRMIRWADNHHKILISIKNGIDTSTDAGRTMAKFMAVVAEMELDEIKSRAKDSYRHLTQTAMRYPGGQIPFGYRSYCLLCAKARAECRCYAEARRGWGLEPDPEYKPVVVEMVDRFLAGESLGGIARWLNSTGTPTSRNIIRIRNGKPAADSVWTPLAVKKILTSHAMTGAIDTTEILDRDEETGKVTKRSERKALTDDNGDLVLRAEPLVSYDTWLKVQAKFTDNPHPNTGKPRVNASPLLSVACCGLCGQAMYITTAVDPKYGTYRYYWCKAANRGNCPAKRFKADALEQEIVSAVLEYAGAWPHSLPHVKPAEEYSGALTQVDEAIANLMDALEAGAFKGRLDVFQARMSEREAKRAELISKPSRKAETAWKPTGKSVAQYWSSLTAEARWDYLRSMHVQAFVAREMPKVTGASTDTAESMGDIPYIAIRENDGVWLAVNLGTLNELRDLSTRG